MSDPSQLRDLLGLNLDGWMLTEVYFLELKHGQMKIFPAILDDDARTIILALNKSDLRHIWPLLDSREARVSKRLALYNDEICRAFLLYASLEPLKAEPLPVFTSEDLQALEDGSVRWAPGLLGGRGDAPPPNFDD